MTNRDLFSRIWYPKQGDVDLLKYGGPVLLRVGSLVLILVCLFFPGRLVDYLFFSVFFGLLVLRGVVLTRGAYTLPLNVERERELAAVSTRSRIFVMVLAVSFLLISLLGLFFAGKYFFIVFITMAAGSMIALAHGGFSTVTFLLVSSALGIVSLAISVLQAGAAGAFASLTLFMIAFPMAFEDVIEFRRATTAWSNRSLQSGGANSHTDVPN